MAFEYEVSRQVVIPSLILKVDEPRFLKIVGKCEVSDIKPKAGFEAATVMRVQDLEDSSGTIFSTIVNSVLKSELEKNYPNDSYVGHMFRVVKLGTGGKKYHTFGLDEIKPKGAPAVPAAPAKAAK